VYGNTFPLPASQIQARSVRIPALLLTRGAPKEQVRRAGRVAGSHRFPSAERGPAL